MVRLGTKKYIIARQSKYQDRTFIVEQAFANLSDVGFYDEDGKFHKFFLVSDRVWEELISRGIARCRQGNQVFVLTLPLYSNE